MSPHKPGAGRCYRRRMADTTSTGERTITPLQAQCISLHEHHKALVEAGFTPALAMAYLIGITRRQNPDGS